MCFVVKKNVIKTAKKDIICWKWLERGLKSPYMYYDYEKGVVTPRVELNIVTGLYVCGTNVINQGYHSFKLRKVAVVDMNFVLVNIVGSRADTYKFIIPKGTRYYENNIEYVSEQIMLVEENS